MRRKFAACIHVYYVEVWDEIINYLNNIKYFVDIYVTCRAEIYDVISQSALEHFENAKILVVENSGMDVMPFLEACRSEQLDEYIAVLKLHTKNQKSPERAFQGKMMLDGLCGSQTLSLSIMDRFEADDNVGMISGAFQIRSAAALMYGNRARVESVLDTLDIRLDDWPFIVGTMFWISGRLLRPLIDNMDRFIDMNAVDQGLIRTGGDGTFAHSMERIFGALPAAAKMTFFVTERMSYSSDDYGVVPLRNHAALNNYIIQSLDSQEILKRYKNLQEYYEKINSSGIFDRIYFVENYKDHSIDGMDSLIYYILYADFIGINPSEEFCTNFYLIMRPDVERKGICGLYHYVCHGRREGVTAKPTERAWIELAQKAGLLSEKWYKDQYPDVEIVGLPVEEHYDTVGKYLNRATNSNFKPASIPSLSSRHVDFGEKSNLSYYMENFLREEALIYKSIKRASSNGDHTLARRLSTYMRTKFGYTRALREAMGTSYVLNFKWSDASREWDAFWGEIKSRESSNRSIKSALNFDRTAGDSAALYDILPEHYMPMRSPKRPSICIYTTLFGGIDDLLPIIDPVPGIDYICFTDRYRPDCGWRQVIIIPDFDSDNLKAKIFKILPHNYLRDYEYSLFVDANTFLIGKTSELVDLCLSGGDFVMWRHPVRKDVYLEACAIIGHGRHEPRRILAQVEDYYSRGLPQNTGLYEASFIWRRHGAEPVKQFMEKWWAEILEQSPRDQLSLGYLTWKQNFKPKVLPDRIGNSRKNDYFEKIPHKNYDVDKIVSKRIPISSRESMPIAFLYADKYQNTGSTILRGLQLSELVKSLYQGKRDVYYTNSVEINNSIVVLTKGFIKSCSRDVISELSRSNVLIADFVDEPIKDDLLDDIEIVMASSLQGYKSYLSKYRNKHISHVTHHVDTRINFNREYHSSSFMAGYFGELVNTIKSEDIEQLVSFNLVDTSKQTYEWMDNLNRYSLHYAVRRTRGIDGAKPFLKGFVAAHCGANMLIQKGAGDARYYLGNDYPFLMDDDLSVSEILEQLKRTKDAFGGPEWELGLEMMKHVKSRSSLQSVLQEFSSMIDSL